MAKKQAGAKAADAPRQILNRRARYEYNILESFEAGLVLQGSEVKSLFLGRANLGDAFCKVADGELILVNLDIEPYEHASAFQPERRRDRKLLVHAREIANLDRKVKEKGLTLIPLKLYFNARGKAKAEIGLARGKAAYDKREKIAKDDARREMERLRSTRRVE